MKEFIKVTIASLDDWKDEKLREGWGLWLKEIQSFSEIPLYFQIFLKTNFCRELLFKILRGEPESADEKEGI